MVAGKYCSLAKRSPFPSAFLMLEEKAGKTSLAQDLWGTPIAQPLPASGGGRRGTAKEPLCGTLLLLPMSKHSQNLHRTLNCSLLAL